MFPIDDLTFANQYVDDETIEASVPLPPWRWFFRAVCFGPMIGGVSALITLPVLTAIVAVFALMVAVPFGLVCRCVIGADRAGGGLVLASALTPFLLIAAVAGGLGPLTPGEGVRFLAMALVAGCGCGIAARWLIVRDEQATQR